MESNVRLTALRRKARWKASFSLPKDLIFEIFSRLPAKSIARFRSVSKSCAAMITREDFTDLYLTRSCARPQLLFACRSSYDREVLFFSAPQPHHLESPSSVAATFLMKVAVNQTADVITSIGGLVSFREYQIFENGDQFLTIVCNPSTRQSFALPKTNTAKRTRLHRFFGYDPIGKQFKVLSISVRNGVSQEHQVLTLPTRQPSWRTVQCDTVHSPKEDVICINGVLYYEAELVRGSKTCMIACFDLRTETYLRFINLTENVTSVLNYSATLVNHNGRLALLVMKWSGLFRDQKYTSFVMCILEDTQTHTWSNLTYQLPSEWHNVVGKGCIKFVGFSGANEIVLSSSDPSDMFYVFYYNLDRSTIRRVAIHGMGETRVDAVWTLLNHVENVKLM